jgi:hypothetical protein
MLTVGERDVGREMYGLMQRVDTALRAEHGVNLDTKEIETAVRAVLLGLKGLDDSTGTELGFRHHWWRFKEGIGVLVDRLLVRP